jgi:hypothetical protein
MSRADEFLTRLDVAVSDMRRLAEDAWETLSPDAREHFKQIMRSAAAARIEIKIRADAGKPPPLRLVKDE